MAKIEPMNVEINVTTTTGQRDLTKYPAVVTGRMPAAKMDDRTNPKAALGATKPMLGLNPPSALVWMAKAFEFGSHGRDALGAQVRPKGYGEYNWRNTEISEMVYVHAMDRHKADYLDGQDLASDSKVKHLAHIMACCAILIDAEECGTLVHDRPPPGKAAELIERLTVKKEPVKTESPDLLLTDKWFNETYSALLKEIENDQAPAPAFIAIRRSRPAGRGKGRRQVKADHHGQRRKARK